MSLSISFLIIFLAEEWYANDYPEDEESEESADSSGAQTFNKLWPWYLRNCTSDVFDEASLEDDDDDNYYSAFVRRMK